MPDPLAGLQDDLTLVADPALAADPSRPLWPWLLLGAAALGLGLALYTRRRRRRRPETASEIVAAAATVLPPDWLAELQAAATLAEAGRADEACAQISRTLRRALGATLAVDLLPLTSSELATRFPTDASPAPVAQLRGLLEPLDARRFAPAPLARAEVEAFLRDAVRLLPALVAPSPLPPP